MRDGIHAAYVIPPHNHFRPKLYCHFASPFQVAPNWLGLEVDQGLDKDTAALAPIVFGLCADELSNRVRAAIRAMGQAFYILTPEARFLSLVFGLDGLCAPKHEWSGLKHHAYIAAVASEGDHARFATWLKDFDHAYSDIRNPIVHRGKSFLELGISHSDISDKLTFLLRCCVDTILNRSITTIDALHSFATSALKSTDFQTVLSNYIANENAGRVQGKHLKTPTW